MIKKYVIYFASVCLSFSAIAKTGVFPRQDFDQLSYGLYWFGANDQYQKGGQNTRNGSTYYDPSRPTLILIHGWQSNHTIEQNRTVYWENGGGTPDIDFANLWRAEGYNVAMLYWDQFADESEVKDAEAKIWSANGPKKMRWRDSRGNYHTGPTENVTELLLQQYLNAMQGYRGNDIRLAGHSLGNQVALRLADRLATLAERGQIANNIVPQRVSLLDAFYSNYSKDYLNGRWVGEAAREAVSRLKPKGIAIDSYRTSAVASTPFIGDENRALHNAVAFVEQQTRFFNQTQQGEKHNAAIWLYLWSIIYPMPVVIDNSLPGISASASNTQVRRWMGTTDHLQQVSGGDTKDPLDNLYETVDAL
ncbi:hypothetical protein [Vibrio gazogenes]|uniref:Cell adhesion domain-containing protein n=1 Tax=Vibrio gazogenes DSM 21264 = NBRC 103151 TaxID=1123492 RepID=A0A1M5GL60_VIBGA|nr:hypothetical protein [Vibrio gazogenes]USP13856.1 hypothetical protein MKS89_00475 [Vibrio gazogenes]SHG04271.1 hypothetical protein SAMN02745781_03832 [Vibrio gazogenes DSM 21264] [Vibrio gazogenes DSM 21264 = NBRC 103151]SJN53261.1 hypothetical protein BQ6471_00353 [Vibrio gazogenes]